MRLPYSWLREVVQAGAPGWDVPPEDLEQALIRVGHEVEDVINLGPVTGPLTVGRVTAIEELTEFKKPIRACRVDVGDALFQELAGTGAPDFAVVLLDFKAAMELTLNTDFFAHEQQRNAKHGLAEESGQRRPHMLAVQLEHGVVEHFQTLDLHLGPWKAVDDDAVVILGKQKLLKEKADDFAVADHLARIFDGHGLGTGEKAADDDRRRRNVASSGNEGGVGPFPSARRPAEPDKLARKPQRVTPELLFEVFPDRREDQVRILDLQVGTGGAVGGCRLGVCNRFIHDISTFE